MFGWLAAQQGVPVFTAQTWVHGSISTLRKCSWTTETTDAVSLGLHQRESLGSGKGTRAFKPSQPLLGASLALGASPCCLRTGLHCSESSVPCRVALLAQACAPFLPSAKEEAIVDLAIVGLCCKLLFCKKGSCAATHAQNLTPHPEEKQQFGLWKFPPGATYRGSKGGPAVRRERRAVDLPFPAHHHAWSLRRAGRWLNQGDTSSVCPIWHSPRAEAQQSFTSGGTLKLLAAFEQPWGAPMLSWPWETKYSNVGLRVFIAIYIWREFTDFLLGLEEAGREENRV